MYYMLFLTGDNVPIVQDLIELVKKEVNNVIEFATNPSKGIFETVDQMVRDVRLTVRKYARRPGILKSTEVK